MRARKITVTILGYEAVTTSSASSKPPNYRAQTPDNGRPNPFKAPWELVGAASQTEEYVEHLARAMGLQEHCVSVCTDAVRTDYRSSIVQASHHIVAEDSEIFFPTRLNVVFTHPPPQTSRYTEWILQSFDMHHCRVALDTEDGRYTFVCSSRAFQDLARRRISLTDRAFCNIGTCANTLRRVDKYLSYGFTFEGDDVNDVELLETLAHTRVRLVEDGGAEG